MNILLLPNAFKGTLSAKRVGQILTRTWGRTHTVHAFPLSDGGDGFIDTFRTLDPRAQLIKTRAKNAFLQTKPTSFLLLSDGKTAVVETARICGLGNTPRAQLDPLGASSYGVGQVIMSAIRHGAKTIYIGLGGVACNDGGAGLAVACGAHILDKHRRPLALGAAPLLQACHLDLAPLKKNCRGVRFIGVADVTNPLLGPRGSARVFGPQKGATPAQVKTLGAALSVWARLIKKSTGRAVGRMPCAGAAGAIAGAVAGVLGGQLLLGADFLIQKSALEKHFPWADLIITGEGKLDAQTFCGKAPQAVLKLAKKYRKPVLFICGSADFKVLFKQEIPRLQVMQLTDFAPSVKEAQTRAGKYLSQIAHVI